MIKGREKTNTQWDCKWQAWFVQPFKTAGCWAMPKIGGDQWWQHCRHCCWDEPCCFASKSAGKYAAEPWRDAPGPPVILFRQSNTIRFCLPEASCIFDSGLLRTIRVEKSVQMSVALSFHIVGNDLFLLKLWGSYRQGIDEARGIFFRERERLSRLSSWFGYLGCRLWKEGKQLQGN